MSNIWDAISGFTSRKAGQRRTQALHRLINNDVAHYVPPNLRGLLGLIGEVNPVNDIYQAGGDLRDGDYVGAATNTAAAALPIAGAVAAKPLASGMAQTGDDALRAIVDSLLGFVPGRGASAVDTVVERANQRGPVPDMHMFAGPKAKTADIAALSRAQEMAETGANRDDIWRDTGWFKGVDGKWRFEIDDSGAVNDIRGAAAETEMGEMLPLGGVMEHADLYRAYPEMADTETFLLSPERLNEVAPGAYGGVTDSGQIAFRNDMIDVGRPLHEMQHIVQQNEGFARGGSPVALGSDDYGRLAGEVEARNVENRAIFDADLRREFPPWQTQDVPDERQIVQFRGGDQMGANLTPAQQQAQSILDLLSQGRASEVTDDMMAAADDVYLAQNYDLPLDEASRMQRAREMGFNADTPLYHATYDDFSAFDNARLGEVTRQNATNYDEGSYARNLAEYGHWTNSRPLAGDISASSDVPLVSRGDFDNAASLSDLNNEILDGAAQGQSYRVQDDEFGGVSAVIPDPRNIRSRFARFDPRLSHLRNLSAGVGGAGLLASGMFQSDENQEMKEIMAYLKSVGVM